MIKTTDLRRARKCVFNLHIHLVFITKYRKCIFKKHHLEELEKIFKKVCKDFDVVLVEVDGEQDHVHLLINYPPMISVSKLVNSLKGVSSRMLRLKCKEVSEYYIGKALWSPSYFASSCGGAPIDVIKKYIQSQRSPTGA